MNDQSSFDVSADRVKLRVQDYLLLDEAGAFDPDRRTELLEGDVYYMSPQHRPHARSLSRLYVGLQGALTVLDIGLEAMVAPSIAMPPRDVPEPDIVVTSDPDGAGLMPLDTVRLVVEVSDSSLSKDRTLKTAIYARNAVPEYWIVDVAGRAIHQFWSPQDDVYLETRVVEIGDTITAATIAGLTIETAAF